MKSADVDEVREWRKKKNVRGALLLLGFFSICLALWLFLPKVAIPAYVQSNSNESPRVSSLACAYSSAQTAGDCNIVVIGYFSGTITISNVTDSVPNTYTQAGIIADPHVTLAIYYCPHIAAKSSNTVTVTLSAGPSAVMVGVLEYRGIAASSPIDGSAKTGSGYSTAIASTSQTTSNANDLIIGAAINNNRAVITAGSGYTGRINSTPNHLFVEEQIVSSIGSFNGNCSMSVANTWASVCVAFKNASGGSGHSAFKGKSASTIRIADAEGRVMRF